MYMYGLDLSMSNTGVTIVDEETNEIVYIGSIGTNYKEFNKLSDEFKHSGKLKHHYDEINKLRAKYPPCVAIIERGFTRFNTSTQVIFKVHGVYNLAFADVPIIYYPPTTVKTTIYKGNASKAELADVIRKRMNVSFKNEDESDSTAVILTYMIKVRGKEWKAVKALTDKDRESREKDERKKVTAKKKKTKAVNKTTKTKKPRLN